MTDSDKQDDPAEKSQHEESVKSDSQSDGSSEGSDGDGATNRTSTRYWLTNDLIALLMASSLVVVLGFQGAGVLDLRTAPKEIVYLYAFAVGTSVAWAFGAEAIEAWRASK